MNCTGTHILGMTAWTSHAFALRVASPFAVYALTAAAEDEPHVPERAVNGITGWIDCYGKAALAGSVFAGGVTDAGSIDGHAALQKAYEMGKNA